MSPKAPLLNTFNGYPLGIKHGLLQNPPFTVEFPIKHEQTLHFRDVPAMFDTKSMKSP